LSHTSNGYLITWFSNNGALGASSPAKSALHIPGTIVYNKSSNIITHLESQKVKLKGYQVCKGTQPFSYPAKLLFDWMHHFMNKYGQKINL